MENLVPNSQGSERQVHEKPRSRRIFRRIFGGFCALISGYAFINRDTIGKDFHSWLMTIAQDKLFDPQANVNKIVVKSLYVPIKYSIDSKLLGKWWESNKDDSKFESIASIVHVLSHSPSTTKSNLRKAAGNDYLFNRLVSAGVLRPITPGDPLYELTQSVDVTIEFRLNNKPRQGEGYEVDNECRLFFAESNESHGNRGQGIKVLLNYVSDPGVEPQLGPKSILLREMKQDHIGVFDRESVTKQHQSQEVAMLKRAVQGRSSVNDKVALQCEFVDGENRFWLARKPQPHVLHVDRS
jgi:hypothetical protein